MKTSYEKILRGVLCALVAAGALTAVSLFLYLRAFHEFKWYDDEGYVMLTQQGFNQGHALYDEIFTQYGPFSYIVRDVIYRALPDSSVTHNANRLISLTFYLWTAVLLAVAAYRLTRSGLLAAIVFAASAVEAAEPLGAEPGHPQDLIVLLLACLLVAATLKDTSFMRPVLLGALLAAISMTKINEGIYLSAALFVTTLFYCRNRTRATKMLWITASAAVMLMPIILMRYHLFNSITWSIQHGVRDRPWIWFAAVQLVAALAWLLVSSSCETSERGKTFPWRPFAAWVVPAGVVALGVVFYCIVRGSSIHGLVDGILLRPQSLPEVFSLPVRSLHSYHAIFAMLIFSLAILCLSYPEFLKRTLAGRGIYVLKIVIGIGFLLRSTQFGYVEGHATFDTAHGFLAAPWAWLLLIPSKQGENADKLRPPSFAEYLLGMVTVLHPLYAYPVSGSQASIVALVVPVFAAVLAHQGFRALLSDLGAYGGLRQAAHVPLLMSVAGSGLVLAYFVSAYHANSVERRARPFLRSDPATGLPGASRLHMPRDQYAEYLALTHNLSAYTDRFLALNALGPNAFNSLYFWTRTDPPTYYNGSNSWFELLRTEEKAAIRNALEATPRPGVVGPLRTVGVGKWRGPLRDYLKKSYVPAIRLGQHAIYLKKDAQPRKPLNIWLLYGERDFATSRDTLPLVHSLLARRASSTLSLWFRTSRNGVLLGLQDEQVTQRQVALYVGIDGKLRGGFVAKGPTKPLFVSPAPVNDGQWHHVVLQVRKTQQTMFVDEVSLGTVDSEFQLDVTPMAQLGAGAWRGFAGADRTRWKVFHGSIQNAVLAPRVVSPKALAQLGPTLEIGP